MNDLRFRFSIAQSYRTLVRAGLFTKTGQVQLALVFAQAVALGARERARVKGW